VIIRTERETNLGSVDMESAGHFFPNHASLLIDQRFSNKQVAAVGRQNKVARLIERYLLCSLDA